MKPSDVFTPTGIPIYSYVERDEDYERRLRNAFSTDRIAISLSGPSKSGKTVLIKKVVSADDLIEVNGANIKSPQDLWEQVLAWMGTAIPEGKTVSTTGSVELSAVAEGSAGIPLLAKATVGGSVSGSVGGERATSYALPTDLMGQVAKEIANSSFTIFIDDFHYMGRELQVEIGKQVKAALEKGIRICIASVPHRADDAVRANPELRGRLEAIDIEPWSETELRRIAHRGFEALHAPISQDCEKQFAHEAYGSPQLMQSICLNACFRSHLDNARVEPSELILSATDIAETLRLTSSRADHRSLVEALHAGPKQRGTERKDFQLRDGSSGDVYRALLVALRRGEGQLSLSYDQILDRVRAACIGESPSGSSIQTSLEHMSRIAAATGAQAIEWDELRLDIVDPYFLFYLKHSNVLDLLNSK